MRRVEVSGTRYTKTGLRSKSAREVVRRASGVFGLVAADSTPSSSAFESNPNLSILLRENPKFSAVVRRPAFSALESNLSYSTLDSSFMTSGASPTLSRMLPFLSKFTGSTLTFFPPT
jgi:hypothetical protein